MFANRYVCRQDEDLEPKQFPIYIRYGDTDLRRLDLGS